MNIINLLNIKFNIITTIFAITFMITSFICMITAKFISPILIISVKILQDVKDIISFISALKFSHLLLNTIVLLTQYANISAKINANISLMFTFKVSSGIPSKN